MAKFSIAKAAKLVGKDRKTLYRHIKEGQLSATKNSDNSFQVDKSELLRVYGEFASSKDSKDSLDTDAMPQRKTINETLDVLQENLIEIATLREKVRGLESLLEAKQESIDVLKNTVILLEHNPKNSQDAQEEKPKKKWWQFS